MFRLSSILLAFITILPLCLAQRPENISICDFYTPSILGENTASNQLLLITIWVNTFVLGNYTTPNIGIPVHGFATPEIYNGTEIALLPYFTGAYNSTNLGGNAGVSKLFLDDGGPVPVLKNMSSNGNTSSAQYQVFNHIYQYFGSIIGCSLQGSPDFPSYQGRTSMYEVHKFMDLDILQMTYFINLVDTAASSLGISLDDASTIGTSLNRAFNTRCASPISISNIDAPSELQSICIAPDCPLDPDNNCSAYPLDGLALAPVNITDNVTVTTGGNGSTIGVPVTSGAMSMAGFSSGANFWTILLLEVAIGLALGITVDMDFEPHFVG